MGLLKDKQPQTSEKLLPILTGPGSLDPASNSEVAILKVLQSRKRTSTVGDLCRYLASRHRSCEIATLRNSTAQPCGANPIRPSFAIVKYP